MTNIVRSRPGERGATLLLITFVATFVLIPMIGLAIDGTMLYWTKAKLSAAVDAAALSAGRALNVGADEAAQESYATTLGQEYFAANFPLGSGAKALTVSGGQPSFAYDLTVAHVRTVAVSATVTVPLLFMPILHINTGTVAANGTASRRDANVILVLDRSGSMSAKANNNSCTALISAVQTNFIDKFTNGRDQLGLVTFSTTANTDFPPTVNFKPGLSNTVQTLKCVGGTSTAEGLYTAWQLIKGINQPTALNVILLFTDGSPSSIVDSFTVKTAKDDRYDPLNTNSVVSTPISTCSASSILGVIADSNADSASDIAHLNKTGVTLGLFSTNSVALSSSQDSGLLASPGCNFSKSSNVPYQQYYVRQDVAYVPETDSHGNVTDGQVYPLDASTDRFAASSNPYFGKIRPDVPRTLRWIAFNAADYQARQIHNDATYAPVVYTIGLAGNETMAMDQNFMERLANDPRANNYDSTKPQGQFVLVADNNALAAAFNNIASQVLHLSK